MVFFINIYKNSESIANYNFSKFINIKFQTWFNLIDDNSLYLIDEFNARPCEKRDFGFD